MRWSSYSRIVSLTYRYYVNAPKEKGTIEEPMPKHTFTQILRARLRKAGYFARATIHAIRRFLGKKVDGKPLSSKLLSSACSTHKAPLQRRCRSWNPETGSSPSTAPPSSQTQSR